MLSWSGWRERQRLKKPWVYRVTRGKGEGACRGSKEKELLRLPGARQGQLAPKKASRDELFQTSSGEEGQGGQTFTVQTERSGSQGPEAAKNRKF